MRTWMVDPALMCDRHLLGEHYEIHQVVGFISKGNTAAVEGLTRRGYLEPQSIIRRHGELAYEMAERGMDHKSIPVIQPFDAGPHDVGFYLPGAEVNVYVARGQVDRVRSLQDLRERCDRCRGRMEVGPIVSELMGSG